MLLNKQRRTTCIWRRHRSSTDSSISRNTIIRSIGRRSMRSRPPATAGTGADPAGSKSGTIPGYPPRSGLSAGNRPWACHTPVEAACLPPASTDTNANRLPRLELCLSLGLKDSLTQLDFKPNLSDGGTSPAPDPAPFWHPAGRGVAGRWLPPPLLAGPASPGTPLPPPNKV